MVMVAGNQGLNMVRVRSGLLASDVSYRELRQ